MARPLRPEDGLAGTQRMGPDSHASLNGSMGGSEQHRPGAIARWTRDRGLLLLRAAPPAETTTPALSRNGAGKGERQRDSDLPGRCRWCDRSGAVGCGVPIDLAEEGAEFPHVGAVAEDQAGNVAETEAGLFL
jgi:hypothetical protein